MSELTPAGQESIDAIAERHGFSVEATRGMLDAVVAGSGRMAQFSHPEFAGPGQWMRGGMTMVSDLFDHSLKRRVDALCSDLADLVLNEPRITRAGTHQSQSQGTGARRPTGEDKQTALGASTLFAAPGASQASSWWPASLGVPDSAGAQNDSAYAYFRNLRRLAINFGGQVTVYDTLHHQIGGFSQQQSRHGTLSFSSEMGPIDAATLPVVSDDGRPSAENVRTKPEETTSEKSLKAMSFHEMTAMIERLADLKSKGAITEAEFAAKKSELLRRI